MTPACRAWTERHADLWARRAAELRASAGDRATALRAACLESTAADLRRRLAAAPIAAGAAAELERRLERIQPYRHPNAGIMINDGEVMDRVRWRLAVRIAELQGRPIPPAPIAAPAPAAFVPPPVALPFVPGPQLGFL